MRYLTESTFLTYLNLGKPVEQWLGSTSEGSDRVLSWMRIDREKDSTYSVAHMQVYDEGRPDFLDVYEFTPLDPDSPEGVIKSFPTKEEAVHYALTILGANPQKFVNAGVIQEEYKDFLRMNTTRQP